MGQQRLFPQLKCPSPRPSTAGFSSTEYPGNSDSFVLCGRQRPPTSPQTVQRLPGRRPFPHGSQAWCDLVPAHGNHHHITHPHTHTLHISVPCSRSNTGLQPVSLVCRKKETAVPGAVLGDCTPTPGLWKGTTSPWHVAKLEAQPSVQTGFRLSRFCFGSGQPSGLGL